MFLYYQKKAKLVNVAKISTLELCGRAVVAMVDGVREVLGVYNTKKRAQMAFDDLVLALDADGQEGKVYRMMNDTAAMRDAVDEDQSVKKILVDAGFGIYDDNGNYLD